MSKHENSIQQLENNLMKLTSKDIKLELVKVANSIDKKAMAQTDPSKRQEMLAVADEITSLINEVDSVEQPSYESAPMESQPSAPAVTATSTEGNTKLSKKDKAILSGFQKSASKMLDRISVGRKEFPDADTRDAVHSIFAALDKGIGALENFGVIPQKGTVTASLNKELEVRLYEKLIASGFDRRTLIAEKVIDENEAELLEDKDEVKES